MNSEEFTNLTAHQLADDIDELIAELKLDPLVGVGMGPVIRVWLQTGWLKGAKFGFEQGVDASNGRWEAMLQSVLTGLKKE